MSRCPNCGQSSKSDFCEWCGYPVNLGGQIDKEKAKRDAKKARQAQQEAKKKADLEAREKAKRDAKEAKKVRQAEQEAKKKADLEAREKAKRDAKESKKARQAEQEAKKDINVMKDLVTESKVNAAYEGIVRIVLPQANLNQVKIVEQYLLQIQNLRLLLVGGSVEAGSEFIVSADKPVPLTSLLERIDFLEGVVAKGNCIQLTMRS